MPSLVLAVGAFLLGVFCVRVMCPGVLFELLYGITQALRTNVQPSGFLGIPLSTVSVKKQLCGRS